MQQARCAPGDKREIKALGQQVYVDAEKVKESNRVL